MKINKIIDNDLYIPDYKITININGTEKILTVGDYKRRLLKEYEYLINKYRNSELTIILKLIDNNKNAIIKQFNNKDII